MKTLRLIIEILMLLLIVAFIVKDSERDSVDTSTIKIEELHEMVLAQDSIINQLTIAVMGIDEDLTTAVDRQARIAKAHVKLQKQIIKIIE